MTTTQTADQIAEDAFEATQGLPHFNPEDRLYSMLEYIHTRRDNEDADIIAACRRRAGL